MARIETDPNYTSPTFSRATATTDLFKATDVQQLAAAVSTHDHSTGKGVKLTPTGITWPLVVPGPANLHFNSSAQRIGNAVNNFNDMVIENATANMMISGGQSAHLMSNAFWDGLNWQRFNQSNQAHYVAAIGSGIAVGFAPAGANPITFGTKFSIDGATGNLAVTGVISFPNGANISGPGGQPVQVNADFLLNGGGLQLRNANNHLTSDTVNVFLTSVTGEIQARTASANGLRSLSANGSVYASMAASAFNVNSTRRVKNNIVPLRDPLGIVCDEHIHGVSYIDVNTGLASVGFIAEDFVDALPEVVHYDGGRPDCLNYGAIGAVTFEALKLLAARVAALETQLAEVKAA